MKTTQIAQVLKHVTGTLPMPSVVNALALKLERSRSKYDQVNQLLHLVSTINTKAEDELERIIVARRCIIWLRSLGVQLVLPPLKPFGAFISRNESDAYYFSLYFAKTSEHTLYYEYVCVFKNNDGVPTVFKSVNVAISFDKDTNDRQRVKKNLVPKWAMKKFEEFCENI